MAHESEDHRQRKQNRPGERLECNVKAQPKVNGRACHVWRRWCMPMAAVCMYKCHTERHGESRSDHHRAE